MYSASDLDRFQRRHVEILLLHEVVREVSALLRCRKDGTVVDGAVTEFRGLRMLGAFLQVEVLHMQHGNPRRILRQIFHRAISGDRDPSAIHLER